MAVAVEFPIFIRVGDSEEVRIGAVIPDMGEVVSGPGDSVRMDWKMPSLAEIFRAAADYAEQMASGEQQQGG